MKTTIDISDSLFEQAKKAALKRQSTLKEVVESSLRWFLRAEKEVYPSSFKLQKHTFRGKGLVKDLAEGDWGEIRRRVYEGRGG